MTHNKIIAAVVSIAALFLASEYIYKPYSSSVSQKQLQVKKENTKTPTLDELVAQRKQEAQDKRLYEKADSVVQELGTDADEENIERTTRILTRDLIVIKRTQKYPESFIALEYNNRLVFEGNQRLGQARITAYVPGKWEGGLLPYTLKLTISDCKD